MLALARRWVMGERAARAASRTSAPFCQSQFGDFAQQATAVRATDGVQRLAQLAASKIGLIGVVGHGPTGLKLR